MKLRALGLLAFGLVLPCAAFAANDWVNMLVQDPAGGLTTGRLCYSTNGHDLSCDAGAPLISTSGTLYVSSNTTVNGTVSASNITAASGVTAGGTIKGQYVQFTGGGQNRTYFTSGADGNLIITNAASTDFGRLQFGGGTSSFPSLKRSGTTIQARLADDSGFAGLEAATISGTFLGDGSQLTGVVASTADRIVSGTTSMIAVSTTGYISITQAATNTGWFDPTRGLVTIGVSSTGPISGTAGYFSGNVLLENGVALKSKNAAGYINNLLTHFTDDKVYLDNNDGPIVIRSNSPTSYIAFASGNAGAGLGAVPEAMRIVSSGNVGIGTTTPAAMLQVSGTFIVSNSSQVTTPSIYVSTGTGNVGIGTNNPGSALTVRVNPGANYALEGLDVNGTSAFTLSTDYKSIAFNANALGLQSSYANARGYINNGSTKTAFGDSTSSGVYFYDGGYNSGAGSAMAIVLGNVGIGFNNTTPNATLHVSGTTRISSWTTIASNVTPSVALDVYGTISATNFVGNGSGLTNIGGASADRVVSGTTSMVAVSTTGYISITQAATNTGWFDPTRGLVTIGVSSTGPISGTSGYFSGNVGVGTSSPGEGPARTTLTIQGSSDRGVLQLQTGASSVSTSTIVGQIEYLNPQSSISDKRIAGLMGVLDGATAGDTGGALAIYTHPDNGGNAYLEKMRVTNAGNVGIGTSSPAYPLDISNSANMPLRVYSALPDDVIRYENVGTGGSIYHVGSTGSTSGAGQGFSVYDVTHNALRLLIVSSSGNVGIGTTAPWESFEVKPATDKHVGFRSSIPNMVTMDLVNDANSANIGLEIRSSPTVFTVGNVGIGTNQTPTSALQVSGTVSATNFVGNGSGLVGVVASASPGGPSGSIQFNLNGSSTSGTAAFVIQNNNVGIGTATPSTTVDIIGRFRIASNGGLPPAPTGGRGLALLYNGGSNTGNVSSFDNDNSVYRNLQLEGAATYLNSASGGNVGIGSGMSGISLTATLQVSGTFTVSNSAQTTNPSIYVSATNGFVGIGTSNPVVTLNASGPGNTDLIRMDGNTGSYVGLSFAPSGTQISSGHAGKIRGYANGTDTDLAFVTNAIERMRILATGNIGIGTATPTTALEVSGTISATNFVGNGSGLAGVTAAAAGPSGSIQFNLGGSSTSGTAAFTFLNNNIGIGTVSPLSATLEVSGSGKFTRGLTVAPAGSGDSIVFRDTTTTKWTQYLSGNDFNFYDVPSATTRLTLQGGTGNVGIGTSAPGIVTGAGRTYLTLKGSSDAGVLEMATAAADTAGNEMGMLQFTDVNSSARGALISAKLAGTTAGNRGGSLNFYTKADGASSLVQRMIMDQSGNVGISTTSPQSKLSVGIPSTALGTAVGAGAGITVGVANAIGFSGENTSAQTVGQGAFLTLYQNDGTAMLSGNRLGGVIFGGASSASALRNSASLQAYADDNWVDGSDYGSYLSLFTTTDGAASRTEKMRITSSGNVGISTTSPNAKLDVYGTISATNFVGNGSGLSGVTASPGGPSGSIQFNLGGSSTSGTAAFVFSNNVIGLGTATPVSTQGIVYHAYNNANTGTSASNASFIADSVYRNATFQGRISSSGSTSFQSVAPDYSASYGQMSIFANSGSPYMALYVSGTEKVRVDQSGNVGIGTTAPSTTLYVQKGSAGGAPAWSTSDVAVFENTAGTAAYIQALSSAASGLVMSTPATRAKYYVLSSEANQAMMFGVSGTEVMRIVSSGNVGIGTASPGTKLDVNGQMQSEGNYTVNYAVTNDGLIVGTGRGSDAVIVANLASGSADLLSLDNAGINKFKVTSAGTVSAVNFVGNGSGLTGVTAGAAGPSGSIQFNLGGSTTSGTAAFTMDSSNVYVGAVSNGRYLSAYNTNSIVSSNGTNGYGAFYAMGSGANSGYLFMGSNNAERGRLETAYNGDMVFWNSASGGVVEKMRILANGNVGIGTLGPGGKLAVQVTTSNDVIVGLNSSPSITLRSGSGSWWHIGKDPVLDALQFSNGATPGATPNMTILGSGNVGIGTTAPTRKLRVQTSTQFDGIEVNNGTNPIIALSGNNTGNDNGALWLGAGGNGGVSLQASGASYLNGGNVGIGDTGPLVPLSIKSTQAKTVTNTIFVQRIGSSEAYASNPFDLDIYMNGAAALANRSYSLQTSDYNVAYGGNLLLQPNTGNVGIGNTSPNGKLVVTGSSEPPTDGDSGVGLMRLSTGTGASTDESLIFGVHDGDYSWIQAIKAGTARRNLILEPTGNNVGIGTTSPQVKLEVNGTVSATGLYINANTGGGTPIQFRQNDAVGWYDGGGTLQRVLLGTGGSTYLGNIDNSGNSDVKLFSGGTGGIYFFNNTAEHMRIQSNGYVGIGNTGPGFKLTISGDAGASWTNSAIAIGNTGTGTRNYALSTRTDGTFDISDESAAAVRLTLSSAGAVRFNAYGAGTLTTDASGNITASSDERLKSIQGGYTRGLADISKLKPIIYKWNALSGNDTSGTYAGFSAQNVQAALPEAVGKDSHGYLTLSDRPIEAALVNAVQELKADNDNLTNEVQKLKAGEASLKAANDNLQNELHAIERRLMH